MFSVSVLRKPGKKKKKIIVNTKKLEPQVEYSMGHGFRKSGPDWPPSGLFQELNFGHTQEHKNFRIFLGKTGRFECCRQENFGFYRVPRDLKS